MQVLSLESVFVYIKLQNREEKIFVSLYTLNATLKGKILQKWQTLFNSAR